MKKKLIDALKFAAFLGLGIFLFYQLYKNQNWEEIKRSITHIDYTWISVCFVMTVLSHFIRGLRWSMLIKPLGYTVSPLNSFVAVMTGYFANLAVPRLGEVSRCYVLNRTNKVPVDKLIGTVVSERIVDVLFLLMLVVLNIILEFSRLRDFFNNSLAQTLQDKFSFLSGFLVYSIMGFMLLIALALFALRKRIAAIPLYQKGFGLIKGFLDGMQSIWRMENRFLFIFYSFAMWMCYYLMVYICFLALNMTDSIGLLTSLTVLVLGSFGFVAPVQGGIGAYHAAVIQALTLYHVSYQQSVTYAFVAHSFQTLVVIVVGAICFLSVSFIERRNRKNNPTPVTSTNATDTPTHPAEAL